MSTAFADIWKRSQMSYCVYCRLHPPFSFPTPLLLACVRSSCGVLRREVRHLVSRVRLLAPPEFCKRPWSLLGPRGDGNGARSSPCPFPSQYVRCCPLSLYSLRSLELPATTEGGAAERQPLARTQGRNLDRSLTSKPTPCVVCLLTPRGRPRV